MAKSKGSKKKDKSRADAVRSAVDQAFQATADRAEQTRGEVAERVSDVTDELTGVVGRLREAIDEARPAAVGELEQLRGEIAALAARVDKLEKAAVPKPARKAPTRSAPRKPATPGGTSASQVSAARAAAKRTTGSGKPSGS